jgi:PAS domain S-box-containing protein
MIIFLIVRKDYRRIDTEIKKSNELNTLLQNEQNKLRNILDKIPFAVYIINKDFDIEYANPVLNEQLGDFFGKKCYDGFNNYKDRCPWCDIEKVLAGNSTNQELKSPINSRFYDVYGVPLKNIDGSFSKLSIIIDITSKKEAENKLLELNKALEEKVEARIAELKKVNAKLMAEIEDRKRAQAEATAYSNKVLDLYNNAPCGYHSLDKNGIFIDINDTELKWLGLKREDVIGKKRIYDLMSKSSREIFKLNFPKFIEKGNVNDLEFEMINSNGKSFSVLVSASAVYDENRNFLYSRSTMFDITDIKEARKEIDDLNMLLQQRAFDLQAANKELEAFSYSASHDLRAPLRAIDGFSKILIEEHSQGLDAEGKRRLDVIRKNVRKMDSLITDLLALSRITRQELTLSEINMTELASEVINDLKHTTDNTKAVIEIGKLFNCMGDKNLIRIVLTNLISNALKFSKLKELPVIKMKSSINSDSIEYCIIDNGSGFNPQYAHKLFRVFQRLHSSEEFEGTGIGLAIVQRIINKHGGKVSAKGKIGEGATFCFTLPRKENNG